MKCDWQSLTNRLMALNLNFSKPLAFEYKNKVLKFKSEQDAIEHLNEFTDYQYDKQFIKHMIESGKFNINEWDKYILNESTPRKSVFGKDKIILDNFINAEHLLKQNDIYNHEFIFYDPLSNKHYVDTLDEKQYNGICIITSIYNAIPKLFDYSKNKVVEIVKDIGQKSFANLKEVIKYLNNKVGKPLFYIYPFNISAEIDDFIKEKLQEDSPIVLTLNNEEYYKKKLESGKDPSGHAITLVGYDRCNYWIYDNVYNNINGKYQIENNIINQLGDKIYDDYMKSRVDPTVLARKYSKIGLTNLQNKIETFKIKEELGKHMQHQNNFLVVNKRMFRYAFDLINAVCIDKKYLPKTTFSNVDDKAYDFQRIKRLADTYR